jgi:CHAD domain-containing protein
LKAFQTDAARIDQDDVEAVHRTRVASRRLRELLPVMGLGATTPKLSRRLTKVTKRLGKVRELDVLIGMIHELGQDPRYSLTALNLVAASVRRDRVAARDRLAVKLSVEKIHRLARRLKHAAKQSELDERGPQPSARRPRQTWVWVLEARAARRAAGVRSAIEAAGTVYASERLHDVRLAVKKLRYTMELGAEAQSRRGRPDLSILTAIQDLLGRLHDLEVLIGRARQEQAALSPATLIAWRELDLLIEALEDDCRALHASYMDDRAKLIAIADRICNTNGHAVFVNRRAAG